MPAPSRGHTPSPATALDAGTLIQLNKRRSARVRYFTPLPVNARLLDGVPQDDSFECVETRDLSQLGVSFYSHHAPAESMVLVQLGDASAPLQMLARIVRCEKDYNDPQKRFVVACEFVWTRD